MEPSRVAPPKNAPWKCRYCTLPFSNEVTLTAHVDKFHPEGRRLDSKVGVGRRMTWLKLTKKGEVKCDVCGQLCSNFEGYVWHRIIHKGMKHVCNYCGKLFETEAHFKMHEKLHCLASPGCRYPQDKFKIESRINHEHLKRNHGGYMAKPAQIPTPRRCGGASGGPSFEKGVGHLDGIKGQDSIANQLELGAGGGLSVAGKLAAQSPMTVALRPPPTKDTSWKCKPRPDRKVVKGKTPANKKGEYNCEVCNKGFTNYHAFIRHKIIHMGSKFVCKYCGKWFSSKAEFEMHEKIHFLPSYRCCYCNEKFKNEKGLYKHKVVVHGGLTEPIVMPQRNPHDAISSGGIACEKGTGTLKVTKDSNANQIECGTEAELPNKDKVLDTKNQINSETESMQGHAVVGVNTSQIELVNGQQDGNIGVALSSNQIQLATETEATEGYPGVGLGATQIDLGTILLDENIDVALTSDQVEMELGSEWKLPFKRKMEVALQTSQSELGTRLLDRNIGVAVNTDVIELPPMVFSIDAGMEAIVVSHNEDLVFQGKHQSDNERYE